MKLAAMTLVWLVSVLMICSASFGQSTIFGGNGFRSDAPTGRTTARTGSGLSNLIDFSNGQSEETSSEAGSSLFWKPKFELFKANPFKRDMDAPPARPFASMPSLMPRRDPDVPGIFEQMSQRSRGFLDRTTSWAQQQNETIKARTQNTWSSLTTDLNLRQNQMGEFFREKSGLITRPPVRASDNLENKPKVRF
jgi:hypothetical protein